MLRPPELDRRKYSKRSGSLLCNCGQRACEDLSSERYGSCRICFNNGLSRAELNKRGLKRL